MMQMVRGNLAVVLLVACGFALANTSALATQSNTAVPKPANKTSVFGYYAVSRDACVWILRASIKLKWIDVD